MKWKRFILIIVGLVCITGLELFALKQGINGVCLAAVVGVIGAVITGGAIKIKDVIKNDRDRTTDHT